MKRWEEKGISFEMQSRPKIKKVSHLLSNNCFLNDALGMGYVAVSLANCGKNHLYHYPQGWEGGHVIRCCNGKKMVVKSLLSALNGSTDY